MRQCSRCSTQQWIRRLLGERRVLGTRHTGLYPRTDTAEAANRATRRMFRKKHSSVFTTQRFLVSKHPRLISEGDTKIVIYRIWTIPHGTVVFQTRENRSGAYRTDVDYWRFLRLGYDTIRRRDNRYLSVFIRSLVIYWQCTQGGEIKTFCIIWYTNEFNAI